MLPPIETIRVVCGGFVWLVGLGVLLASPRFSSSDTVHIYPTKLTLRCVNVRWTNPYQIPMRAISLLTQYHIRHRFIGWFTGRLLSIGLAL